LFIQLCGQIFIIGETIAAMVAALLGIDPSLVGASDITVEPAPKWEALLFFMLATTMGFVAGLTAWICTMRRFSNRAQLYKYFTEPYVPVVSDCAGKVFDLVYEAVRKPHGLERRWR